MSLRNLSYKQPGINCDELLVWTDFKLAPSDCSDCYEKLPLGKRRNTLNEKKIALLIR